MTTNATLTEADFQRLMAGDTITDGEHSISIVLALSDPWDWLTADARKDRVFLMIGPDGKHSLMVGKTDLDRLNAHWARFRQNAHWVHSRAVVRVHRAS